MAGLIAGQGEMPVALVEVVATALYDLNDFLLLARLTLESEATRALAWHDEMVGPVRLPRPVFVVSLAASCTDMPLHHSRA
jgi:hypothetical protein